MEKATQNLQGKWNLVLVVLITLFFSSCDAYNFSEPQPVDQENRYDFPNSYLGSWTNADISDQDMYIEYHIHKNYVLFITQVKERIASGAWPRVNDKGEYRYPTQKPIPESGVLMTIRYDSLKRPVDTVRNYLFRSGFIYKVEEKGLSKGYTYKKEQDTIILFRNDTNFIDLGANAFLRPLDKDKYVLNIRNRILGEDNDWWRVMILEKMMISPWLSGNVLPNQVPFLTYSMLFIMGEGIFIISMGDGHRRTCCDCSRKDILPSAGN